MTGLNEVLGRLSGETGVLGDYYRPMRPSQRAVARSTPEAVVQSETELAKTLGDAVMKSEVATPHHHRTSAAPHNSPQDRAKHFIDNLLGGQVEPVPIAIPVENQPF